MFDKIIDSVCKVYNVNKNWILTGKGEIFSENPPDIRLQEMIDIYQRLNPHFQGYILEQIRALDRIQETKPQEQGQKPAHKGKKPPIKPPHNA